MDSDVIVDGEASETESEYESENESLPSSPPTDLLLTPSQPPADQTSFTKHPGPSTSTPLTSSPPPFSSPPPTAPLPTSLTLFEENLRTRNAVFASSLSNMVAGHYSRVVSKLKVMGLELRSSQGDLVRCTGDLGAVRSNLIRGVDQLDNILAFSLLPQR